ncbi:type 1 fimbrial protein [Enterobacter hormaechei]|nr:type 1 fimbrial protein [Enterobacter hormaechei]
MQTTNRRTHAMGLGLLLLTCAAGVQAADNVKVTVNSNVLEGSCDVSGPATQAFSGGHRGSEFTPTHRTAETILLNITVKNCKGSVAGKKPTILVTGPLLAGQTDIFADGSSAATNVGVAVREGRYTGSLNAFYSAGQMVSQAKPETYKGNIDATNGGSYPYTLGLVSDDTGIAPGLGQVKATLTFEFKYQ